MTALDELRAGLRAPVFSLRGLVGLGGLLSLCGGLAVALHDALDPDPLLGWRTGLVAVGAGVALIVAASLLTRRRHDRLAARLGVSRADAKAVWDEDDEA